jgi:hypothetical protein
MHSPSLIEPGFAPSVSRDLGDRAHRDVVSALLPQPGGFEGSVPVGVGREANDLAIAKRRDVKEAVPDLGTAPFHPPAILDGGDDPVLVGVKHLNNLDMEIFERLPVREASILSQISSATGSVCDRVSAS